MLAKNNRLRKKKDFENVFKNGKIFKERFLFLKIIENGLEHDRFGFIVSKKISKKAVVRNKIKRRLRDIVKKRLKDMNNDRLKIDGVFMVRTDIVDKSFKEIEESADSLLKQAKA